MRAKVVGINEEAGVTVETALVTHMPCRCNDRNDVSPLPWHHGVCPLAQPETLALKEIERLASLLIGRFHAACGGRHFEGRTCDYCLVDDILRIAREHLPTPVSKPKA